MTTQITLAKALQLKNRIAGRLAKLQGDVQTYNSVQKGTEQPDIKSLFAECDRLSNYLATLKTTIQQANMPIVGHIFRIGELRSWSTFLAGIQTKSGTYSSEYGDSKTEYDCAYNKETIDEMVDTVETRIDAMQDDINTHNAKTMIEIDPEMLILNRRGTKTTARKR